MSDNPMQQEDGRLPWKEMRPCPWCGSDEHLSTSKCGSLTSDMPDRPYRVVCNHIDHDQVQGPVAYGPGAAIAAWNKRDSDLQSDLDRQADAIGVLREKLDAAVEALEGVVEALDGRVHSTPALSALVNAHATIARIRGEDA